MKKLKILYKNHIKTQSPPGSNWIPVFLFLFFTLNSALLTPSYAEPPNRIISLAPSITEILFAAGLGDRIAGVTTFCDYPEEAKEKPKIGGMSNPSLEAVVSLKPDIVVMTTDGNPKEFEQRLHSMKIRTYVFRSRRLSDLPDGIRKMGIALDAKPGFDALALEIEKALAEFKTKKILDGKKIVFIIWPEPLIVAGPGTAIDDAITLLGAENIARDTKMQYPKYSMEEIVRRSPDVIFIGTASGMDMRKTSRGLLKRISYIPAVKNNKVFYVSDSLYRLGPRVIKGIEELEGYLR
ncbi:MAG TPA: cobalamin-binding protein [Nitrospirae bacterium]|nr:vitamin B12-binding protein precursor [bacterium BMS3Abin07]HDH11288.1 cobalamin-binding protein [Nitrospirota bacterium]HDZ00890.1 cobalamin-binding protein [Nitrospirota bacterium]